ncbi:MAG: hypothetical protein ACK4N6_05680 [Rhodocyclaceae bacterium]
MIMMRIVILEHEYRYRVDKMLATMVRPCSSPLMRIKPKCADKRQCAADSANKIDPLPDHEFAKLVAQNSVW